MEIINMMKDKIKNWYVKDKNIIKISVITGFAITFGVALYTKSYAERTQADIAKELIRFHVIANSDSADDQNLKIKIKDEVLETLSQGLSASESLEETKEFLTENIPLIEETAKKVIEESGYSYSVKAGLSKDKFPTKTYGDIMLPAGFYDAMRIEIGEAEGANWWCVMFPPLCFIDVAKEEAPEEMKEILKENLSAAEYELISTEGERSTDVKIKFKIIELWQEMKEDKKLELIKNEEVLIWKNEGDL